MYEEEFENVESKEDLEPAAQNFLEELDVEHLVDRLEGRDGGLRPSKPKAQNDNDLVRYVWRIARFHSGDDPSIPVTASWDLENYLESESPNDYGSITKQLDLNPNRETIDTRSKGYKQIMGISHTIARVCVAHLKGNPNGGIERWQKAFYG